MITGAWAGRQWRASRANVSASACSVCRNAQRSTTLPDGGVMLWSVERPESVYAASPGSDLLVEVYSPSPERARALVRHRLVAPLR